MIFFYINSNCYTNVYGSKNSEGKPKNVIVVDDDIDVRSWEDVIWAMSTRMDPVRDVTLIENTPIDYLDFLYLLISSCNCRLIRCSRSSAFLL